MEHILSIHIEKKKLLLKLKDDFDGNNFVDPGHNCSTCECLLDEMVSQMFDQLSDVDIPKDIKILLVYIASYVSYKDFPR